MPFYTFDKTKFPIVKIKLTGKIYEDQLDALFYDWESLYSLEKKHYILFDIYEIDNPDFKSAYKLISFIQKIKKKQPQYLKKSLLIIRDNKFLKFLFSFIFKITKPAAPLYMYWKQDHEIYVNNDTIQEIFETQNNKFQIILP